MRGELSFQIKFKLIAPGEYECLKRVNREYFSSFLKEKNIDVYAKSKSTDIVEGANLVDYLLRMDEKLDRIIDLLSKDEEIKGVYRHGAGENISGSGMKIIVDEPVECGQIIHVKLFLSKLPLTFMEILGEVTRVTPVDENGQILYQLGTKFIDLNIDQRERIISTVFQKQREMLRKKNWEEK